MVDPYVALVNVGSPYTILHTDSPPVDHHFTTAPYLAEEKDLRCFPDQAGNPQLPVFLQNPGPQVRFEYKTSASEEFKPSINQHNEQIQGVPHYSDIFPVNFCGQTSNHNDLAQGIGLKSDGTGIQYACKGYVRITATLSTVSAADGKKKYYRAQKEFGCKDIYDNEKKAYLKEGDIYPESAIPIVPLLLQEYQPLIEAISPSILLNSTPAKSSVMKLPAPQ